jgi:error-prone DNA polymerase
VVQDYASTALSLKAHPVSFVREKLKMLRILSTHEINNSEDGISVKASGLVLVRQRPGTASGICFITIEDETGSANLVVFEKIFNQFRKEILQARLLMVEGKLQREGKVVHVVVRRCYDLSKLLRGLTPAQNENLPLLTPARGDEKTLPSDVYPKGRNFR